MGFHVKFWGVRGSIACPGADHVVYGGNTSCIHLTLDDHHIILDAGTGIRRLGRHMMEKNIKHASLLLTHTHWDHISGFPFFGPLFQADQTLQIFAGHLHNTGGIQAVFAHQMASPSFPIPLDGLRAHMDFVDFRAGETFSLAPGLVVRTCPLRHPNGATAYRIDYRGVSACLVTDTEHVIGHPDQKILSLIEGADLVIYDSTYTDEEFPHKIGWGHSTWQEGLRLCRQANVKRLALFHHDPDHDDAFMARLEETARCAWDGAFVARDTLELCLP